MPKMKTNSAFHENALSCLCSIDVFKQTGMSVVMQKPVFYTGDIKPLLKLSIIEMN